MQTEFHSISCLKPFENSSVDTCTALKNASASCALGSSIVILYNKAAGAIAQKCKNIWNSFSCSESRKAACGDLDSTRVTEDHIRDRTVSPKATKVAADAFASTEQKKGLITDERLAFNRANPRSKSDPGFPTKQADTGVRELSREPTDFAQTTVIKEATPAATSNLLVDANSTEVLDKDKSDSGANLSETVIQGLPKEHAGSIAPAMAEAESPSMQTGAGVQEPEHTVPAPQVHVDTDSSISESQVSLTPSMQTDAGAQEPEHTVSVPQAPVDTDNSSAAAPSTPDTASTSADIPKSVEGQTDVQPASQQTDEPVGSSTESTMPAAPTQATSKNTSENVPPSSEAETTASAI